MRIALLGDIALFGRNTAGNAEEFRRRYGTLKPLLQSCDYVVGNRETPLTAAVRTIGGKSAYIKGGPEEAELLRWLGVTHVTLANNHIFDYGIPGIEDTLKVLEAEGIRWYGVNGRAEELTDASSTLCLRGYCCYSTNAKGMGSRSPCVDILDPAQMERDFSQDAARNCLTIASCHWGEEHVHYPNSDHVRMVRKMLLKYPVVFHGHHPHVIQGMETLGRGMAAYSLGNFCFDHVYTDKSARPLVQLSRDNMESLILVLTVEKSRVTQFSAVPFSFEGEVCRLEEGIRGNLRESLGLPKGTAGTCEGEVFGGGVFEGDIFGGESLGREVLERVLRRENSLEGVPDRLGEIGERLVEWSAMLGEEQLEYERVRRDKLTQYLNGRKKKRDLEWYLKRLRPDSARMLLGAWKNRKRYDGLVGRYLEGQEWFPERR